MNQFKRVTKEFIINLLRIDNVSDEQLILFQSAFVHSSVIQRYGPFNVKKILGCDHDYEELEFLGDRVMELVSGEYLYDQCRRKKKRFQTPPGIEFNDGSANFMTRAKSRMVKKESFSEYASAIGLSPYICVVSKDDYGDDDEEDCSSNFIHKRTVHSKSILEDVFEAFIGVCYECFDWHITRDFVQGVILENANWDKIMHDSNYKDKILRFYTSIEWGHPEYAEISKKEVGFKKWEFTTCVLSPVPLKGLHMSKKVSCFQSNQSNSRAKMWLIDGNDPPKGFVPTGSSGYIAGIGRGRKLKDAEQLASMNAMVNFKSLLDF